jgi:hypothetical protein
MQPRDPLDDRQSQPRSAAMRASIAPALKRRLQLLRSSAERTTMASNFFMTDFLDRAVERRLLVPRSVR